MTQSHLIDPGMALLEQAMTEGRADLLQQWLALSADINHPRFTTHRIPTGEFPDGQALLLHAIGDANPSRIELVRLLLQSGAKPALHVSADGDTPLMRAIDGSGRGVDDIHMAQMLLQAGADVNAQNHDGRAAIHFATRRGDVAMMSLLADHGANLMVKDCEHSTALHRALDHAPACQWLLDREPSLVDMLNSSGSTALILAVGTNKFQAVQTLMAAGANPRACSIEHGVDAYALGEFLGRREIVAWMENFEVAKAARATIEDVLRKASKTTVPGGGGPA